MIPGETILTGADPTCDDCGVTPVFGVYHSGAGYYVGTYCNCGPYSRESSYYRTHELAEQALKSGDFARVMQNNDRTLECIELDSFDELVDVAASVKARGGK